MSLTRVIFVNRPAHARTGARRMRVRQLCAMIAPHLDDAFTFETVTTPPKGRPRLTRRGARQVEGAIVVFHKRAWLDMDAEAVALWRDRARAIAVDWIDARVIDPSFEVDLHIAASEAGRAHLAQRFGETRAALVDHHADPAFTGLPPRGPDTALAAAYLGNPANTALPEAVAARIHRPAYSGGPITAATVDDLARANLHWAVRGAPPPDERTWFKPFTKGAIAAALGANVMADRGADDALRFLGPDYPFLVDDTRPETLSAALDRAEGAIGTPLWDEALAVMADVAAQLTPERIAAQVRAALDPFRA